MSTHFFGLSDRTYSYSHSVGRSEFSGTGFRNPVDFALGSDDIVYILNRSYENRPDGIHVTVCTMSEEYISEFGSYGEADGQFMWPTSIVLDKDEKLYIADEWLKCRGHRGPGGDIQDGLIPYARVGAPHAVDQGPFGGSGERRSAIPSWRGGQSGSRSPLGEHWARSA